MKVEIVDCMELCCVVEVGWKCMKMCCVAIICSRHNLLLLVIVIVSFNFRAFLQNKVYCRFLKHFSTIFLNLDSENNSDLTEITKYLNTNT